MDADGLARLSAAEIGRRLAAGRLDAVAVTEHFLDRIERAADPAVFIIVTRERALREARAARRRLKRGAARGALDGVPVAWKDVVDLAGTVTTMGSRLYARRPPAGRDAPVARNLAAAGMVSLGKTNLPEFAYSGLGINPHYGTPRNPCDAVAPRLCGGSSTGSAAAVAGGLAPVAIGSDTAGSVRIPAAWCGLAGLHCSHGSIDMSGVLGLAPSLDTVGVIGRTVADTVLVARAMAGEAARCPRPADPRRLVFLVPENEVFDGVADDIAANFEAAMGRLARAGAQVVRRRLDAFAAARQAERVHGRLLPIEGHFLHMGEFDAPGGELIDPFIKERFRAVAQARASDYLALLEARRALALRLAGEMEGCDVIAYPTVRETAPLIAGEDKPVQPSVNTQFGNFFAMCGLALPSGRDRAGLPTSLALAARGGADHRLAAIGLAVERALAG